MFHESVSDLLGGAWDAITDTTTSAARAVKDWFPEYEDVPDADLEDALARKGIDPAMAVFRRRFPEYDELSDEDVRTRLSERRGQTPADYAEPISAGKWQALPERIGARALELGSGLVSGVPPTAAEAVQRSMPHGVAIPGLGAPSPTTFAPGPAVPSVVPFSPDVYRGVQRDLRAQLPEPPPDTFPGLAGIQDPGAGDVLAAAVERPAATVGWAVRQGIASLPDMAAALANFPAYAAAMSGLMAEERAEAQGRADPAAADRAIGALGGTLTAVLGRSGASAVLRGLPPALRQKMLGASLPVDIAQRALTEAVTEAGQEIVEGVTTGIGTEEGIPPLGGRAVKGAIGGFGGGTALGSPFATADWLARRRAGTPSEIAAEAAVFGQDAPIPPGPAPVVPDAPAASAVFDQAPIAAPPGSAIFDQPPVASPGAAALFDQAPIAAAPGAFDPQSAFAPPVVAPGSDLLGQPPPAPVSAPVGQDTFAPAEAAVFEQAPIAAPPAPVSDERVEAAAAVFEQAVDAGADPETALAAALEASGIPVEGQPEPEWRAEVPPLQSEPPSPVDPMPPEEGEPDMTPDRWWGEPAPEERAPPPYMEPPFEGPPVPAQPEQAGRRGMPVQTAPERPPEAPEQAGRRGMPYQTAPAAAPAQPEQAGRRAMPVRTSPEEVPPEPIGAGRTAPPAEPDASAPARAAGRRGAYCIA